MEKISKMLELVFLAFARNFSPRIPYLGSKWGRFRDFSFFAVSRRCWGLGAFSYSYIWKKGFKMLELVFLASARNFWPRILYLVGPNEVDSEILVFCASGPCWSLEAFSYSDIWEKGSKIENHAFIINKNELIINKNKTNYNSGQLVPRPSTPP